MRHLQDDKAGVPPFWTPAPLGLGRNLSRGSNFMGSMKNLSPFAYEVATMPSCILIVKNCRNVGSVRA